MSRVKPKNHRKTEISSIISSTPAKGIELRNLQIDMNLDRTPSTRRRLQRHESSPISLSVRKKPQKKARGRPPRCARDPVNNANDDSASSSESSLECGSGAASSSRVSSVISQSSGDKENENLFSPIRTRSGTPVNQSTHAYKSNKKKPVRPLSESEEDYSEEFNDSDIEDVIQQTQKITVKSPLKALEDKGSLKMKLGITRTPRGTRHCTKVTMACSPKKRIPKIRIKLPPRPKPTTTVETLKDLACRLHLSEVPEKLPCRDNEASEVRAFISEAIDPEYGESSAIYISGVPGTGKTATVRSVVESMQSEEVPNFVYVEVNAMIFRKKVFVEIYNGIQESYSISKERKTNVAGAKVAPMTARRRLNTIFRKADPYRPPIVILIDELDGLCNKKQDVLYDIFDWTSMPEARVTIIAIANTLDFPERMLSQRITSRLDKRRLIFQPYNHEQISEIVHARLNGSDAIEANAVKFVARKVSSISGDLRQALDMLRRSINVAIEMKAEKLNIDHVTKAQKAIAEPLKHRLVKGLRLHKFTLFQAVLTELQRPPEPDETIFSKVYKTYSVLCQTLCGVDAVSDGDAYEMLLQLARCSLVVLGTGNNGMLRRRIKLGMARCEAEKCVKDVEEMNKGL